MLPSYNPSGRIISGLAENLFFLFTLMFAFAGGSSLAEANNYAVRISIPGSTAEQGHVLLAKAAGGPTPPTAVEQRSTTSKPTLLLGHVPLRKPLKNLPKWIRVRDSENSRPSFTEKGMASSNKKVSAEWLKLRQQFNGADIMEKLKRVNAFFNRWPYKIDLDLWGVEDYWATPREFLQKSGDCEDYAIAKYYALKDLGVPIDDMRIVAVVDSIRNLGHAILVVYVHDDAYVLDNLSSLVLSHKKWTQYVPKFSVNDKHLWGYTRPKSIPKK